MLRCRRVTTCPPVPALVGAWSPRALHDVNLPHGWHLNPDKVAVPAVPTTGRVREAEICRYHAQLPSDLRHNQRLRWTCRTGTHDSPTSTTSAAGCASRVCPLHRVLAPPLKSMEEEDVEAEEAYKRVIEEAEEAYMRAIEAFELVDLARWLSLSQALDELAGCRSPRPRTSPSRRFFRVSPSRRCGDRWGNRGHGRPRCPARRSGCRTRPCGLVRTRDHRSSNNWKRSNRLAVAGEAVAVDTPLEAPAAPLHAPMWAVVL